MPAGRVVADADSAAWAAEDLGWPVALKLSSPAIQHKSEAGAIALGLADPAGVLEAAQRLLALPAAAGAELLIESMAAPGVELLVAARADAVVPALVIGLGGIWTEALDDVAVIPLPASAERVERALRSLRGAALLTGGRGRSAVDLAAVAKAASARRRSAPRRRARAARAQPADRRARRLRGRRRGLPVATSRSMADNFTPG